MVISLFDPERMNHYETASSWTSAPCNFTGEYTRAVDAKGRFNLPFRFRKALPGNEEEKYVLTSSPEGALALMPYATWLENFNRVRQGPPSKARREFLRMMSRASHEVTPDSQGRIAVPARFLAAAGVAKKVTVIGVGDYMELWNPESLPEISTSPQEMNEQLSNEFFR